MVIYSESDIKRFLKRVPTTGLRRHMYQMPYVPGEQSAPMSGEGLRPFGGNLAMGSLKELSKKFQRGDLYKNIIRTPIVRGVTSQVTQLSNDVAREIPQITNIIGNESNKLLNNLVRASKAKKLSGSGLSIIKNLAY